jgi:pyruvate dehydrogenase E2 component (dihydrolipoamide acetyltransferase)
MSQLVEVKVPDIGDFKDIPVIEVLVQPGDAVNAEDSLITLESDKATLEVPSPAAGTVKDVKVRVGDKVSEGSVVLLLEKSDDAAAGAGEKAAPPAPSAAQTPPAAAQPPARQSAPAPAPEPPAARTEPAARAAPPSPPADTAGGGKPHASPSVRRLAREFGVDLARVSPTGPKERIVKEDVQAYVKSELARGPGAAGGIGLQLPPAPEIDYSKFGPVESRPLSRIRKISGATLHRNWVTIPHVTQHGEADITDLESFRKSQAEAAAEDGVKLTLLAFLMKACVVALKRFPDFNSSLAADGENLVTKSYYHIGIAVDTPNGLVVPVIREVDKKGLLELARELGEVSARVRAGKIAPADLQGGCFSISSLGGIGGSYFTPIINAPEVAVLGVGRAAMRPSWDGSGFVPRLILPLSLSYDHRVIDGAQGARFMTLLSEVLADIRRLVL